MGLHHSPRIITNGLTLCLDAANIKSFRGEPTTNILPNAENNGRFTTSNSWATYNTNQYNNGQFFSIGTVSSVSNNIVTMTSSHPLRSFDVMRPQTSGGGLTANTDYVVKKISSTQFSLHQYDGSQDGSRGYTNPSTGFFKVHDAYATDTRISINSTDFPTMWWGAPHLPNSGLIKEIVPNGGYAAGTNCMRLHVYRGDGVVDGMAYGVYPHVTQGDVITVSVYVRTTSVNGVGKYFSLSTHFGGSASGGGGVYLGPVGVWQRMIATWTASVTYDFILYWWPEGSSSVYSIDMADIQVEINKGGRATEFTTGTRGGTVVTGGGLIDLSGSANHGELVNVPTYDSSNLGILTFNGVNNYISIANSSSLRSSTELTVSMWIKANSITTGWVTLFGQYPYNGGFLIFLETGGKQIRALHYPNGNEVRCNTTEEISTTQFKNVVFTFKMGDAIRSYFNGVASTTESLSSGTFSYNTSNAYNIGYGGASAFNGYIGNILIHNKALSANEVLQNYNSMKGRYGL